MEHGAYKKVLLEVFDALGYSEEEKEHALETFKRKLAADLFQSVQDSLTEQQRQWLAENGTTVKGDEPELADIRKTIGESYSDEELRSRSDTLFRKILEGYVEFVSVALDEETKTKLQAIVREYQ